MRPEPWLVIGLMDPLPDPPTPPHDLASTGSLRSLRGWNSWHSSCRTFSTAIRGGSRHSSAINNDLPSSVVDRKREFHVATLKAPVKASPRRCAMPL